jgi:hypothetical protein
MKKLKSYKCICCGFKIKPLLKDHTKKKAKKGFEIKPEEWMWDGGAIVRIVMPYGSILDGNEYYIGICDKCIEEKEKQGIIDIIKYDKFNF